MGKAENIKRAKRLKDAKRKREQDVLIAAGLGPAAKVLQKRTVLNGGAVIINQDKVKYSELLKTFVDPIVSKSDDIGLIKTKYLFGAQAWNAAIVKEKDEKMYQSAKGDVAGLIPGNLDLIKLFEEMVRRKEEEFSAYKNIIADFEIKKIQDFDYDLTVATIPSKGL